MRGHRLLTHACGGRLHAHDHATVVIYQVVVVVTQPRRCTALGRIGGIGIVDELARLDDLVCYAAFMVRTAFFVWAVLGSTAALSADAIQSASRLARPELKVAPFTFIETF